MLRVTIEVVPDNNQLDKSKPIFLRQFEIKEETTSTPFIANYKTRTIERMGASKLWKRRQVINFERKDYFPELLVYLALEPHIRDTYLRRRSYVSQLKHKPPALDYKVWKATYKDRMLKEEERDWLLLLQKSRSKTALIGQIASSIVGYKVPEDNR